MAILTRELPSVGQKFNIVDPYRVKITYWTVDTLPCMGQNDQHQWTMFWARHTLIQLWIIGFNWSPLVVASGQWSFIVHMESWLGVQPACSGVWLTDDVRGISVIASRRSYRGERKLGTRIRLRFSFVDILFRDLFTTILLSAISISVNRRSGNMLHEMADLLVDRSRNTICYRKEENMERKKVLGEQIHAVSSEESNTPHRYLWLIINYPELIPVTCKSLNKIQLEFHYITMKHPLPG